MALLIPIMVAMTTSTRIAAAILLLGVCAFAATEAPGQIPAVKNPSTIHFQGSLTDTVFKPADSLLAELVESGEKHSVQLGAPFEFNLPMDTLWNLCFTSKLIEKCYDIKYLGHDSAFSMVINGDELVTWFSDSTVAHVAKLPDSSQAGQADTVDVSKLISGDGKATELRKVVVQLRKKPKHRMGESVVSSKQIKRLPGLAEADVIRSLQALPGVVASSDFSTKIYVRGGGADQNLFLFDNSVVYSPVHFFGLFSTFLVEGIDDVKFYKSGFAPQYGNRLSSVVDLRSRVGGQDTVERIFDSSSVKISSFASQVHTEGHEGDTRWLVAARSTYIKQILDGLHAAKVIDFTLDYHFTDIQGNVVQSLGEDRSLGLSWYTGSDVLLFDPIDVNWGNTAVPLNFKWRLNDDWIYNATASYSKFQQTFSLTDLFTLYNAITTLSLKQSMTNRNWIEDHEFTAGWDLEHDNVNFTEEVNVMKSSYVDTSKVWMNSVYLQDLWRPGPWEINYGARLTYQNLANDFAFEPRISAQYRYEDNNLINAHLGYYKQYLNSVQFSDQEMLNEFYYPSRKATTHTVKPTSSILTTLGYTREKLFNQWTFNSEAYYKTQDHLIIFNTNSTSSTSETQMLADYFKEARGYSLGYELSLKRNEGVITGGINWSQGWSVVKEAGDSVPYYPNWHQPFAFKGDVSINWKGDSNALMPHPIKGRFFRSSATVKYASGLPYTEYLGYQQTQDLDQSDNGKGSGLSDAGVPDNLATRLGNRNTSLRPSYFRIDVKPIDIGREGRWNFSWTILNVTNHENLFMVTTDTKTNPPTEKKIYQFPFFPVLLNYEYYF